MLFTNGFCVPPAGLLSNDQHVENRPIFLLHFAEDGHPAKRHAMQLLMYPCSTASASLQRLFSETRRGVEHVVSRRMRTFSNGAPLGAHLLFGSAFMYVRILFSAWLLTTFTAKAATLGQVAARYLDIGNPSQAASKLLASDSGGNLFTVSSTVELSGKPQIRVIKTDPQGREIGSFDFGGSSVTLPDVPSGAAIDPQGNLVIVGTSNSSDFPLVSPLPSTAVQGAFVTKIDAQLHGILFSTRLGGSHGGTSANAVAIDNLGNIYVTGSTSDTDFPVTPGAFQTQPPTNNSFGSAIYAFVTQISARGDRAIYSTYFGASKVNCSGGSSCIGVFGNTAGTAVAVDTTGNVIFSGTTTASNLPVTAAVYAQQCGCANTIPVSFVAKLANGGMRLLWATYLPLAQAGVPYQSKVSSNALAVDNQGNVIVGGAASTGFPITNGIVQPAFPKPMALSGLYYAGFVCKFDPSGQHLLFSTYFGGNSPAFGTIAGVQSVAVDSLANVWITGGSDPSALPAPVGTALLGPTYIAGLSSDATKLLGLVTAPSGAAGQSIAVTGQDTVIALGKSGSLLLASHSQGPSLVGLANSAAFQVSGEIAPYELISLYGGGLGPTTPANGQIANGILATSLGGVQVLFDGTAAPLLFAGPNQINAIVPSGVSGRTTTTVQVITPSGTINGPSLFVTPSEPQVFANGAPPLNTAVALNQNGSVNSAMDPTAAGSIVTIWATGAGARTGPDLDGAIITAPLQAPILPVSVLSNANAISTTGLDSLEVLYAGDAPGLVAGVLQVNFRLPEHIRPGSNQMGFTLQIGSALGATFQIYVAQ